MIYSIKVTYGLKLNNWSPKILNISMLDKIYEKNNANKKILTKSIIL
jgi:hypothetical protein